MCRFLIVKAKEAISPDELLNKFADMAEKSKAPDGDWQGDGWGAAWLEEGNKWNVFTSLLPVWMDRNKFGELPKTKLFLAHARSASFPQQKGILEYNQPYVDGEFVFVFNGWLRGVSLTNIPGKIGAEKIWFLVRKELEKRNPQEALDTVRDMLIKNTREVIALNLGLADKENIYSVSYYTQHPEYYQLRYVEDKDFKIVCSEELNWKSS